MIYQLLKLAHILAAIVGVGPALLYPILAHRIASQPERAEHWLILLNMAERCYNLAGMLLVASGIGFLWLTDGFYLTQPWLWGAGLLLLIDNQLERLLRVPTVAALQDMVTYGIRPASWRTASRQLLIWAWCSTSLLTGVITLMVMRPSLP
ncbi:DUF2269 family protein [Chitinivorax sp. B]|uniref:DUF2269 family protein n=1 Tax=Chitinivorax sp. B TaxID=2502235 RepID=UPI0010F52965|nr:DUF2269 family protein [Chitinivorax sp. B]